MKILVTGAHFTPALASIYELKKYPNVGITYVGRSSTLEGDTSQAMESRILPQRGIKFISLTTGRLQRSLTPYTIFSILKIPIGFIQALYIILSEKPNVVLSFGGYTAVPIVFMAWLFSIPIIIHEQTLVSGLANSFSAFFASKIALSFFKNLKDKRFILTGNPLRKEILEPKKDKKGELSKFFQRAIKDKLPVIFVTGGNQGSHIINETIEKSLPRLLKFCYIIHQTGSSKFKDFERLQKYQNEKYLVKRWIDIEIGYLLREADLVISRAGANTLTELAYYQKPTLVIPIPYLYHDEQSRNAKFFNNLGLVEILPQSKLSSQDLIANIRKMINNLDILKLRAKKANSIIIADAAKRIALETIILAKQR